MKKLSLIIFLLVICLAFLIQSCVPSEGKGLAVTKARSDFTYESDVRMVELKVPRYPTVHELQVQLHVDYGVIRWRLVDPNGVLVWDETFSAPVSLVENREMELLPGRWVIEIGLETASGGYDIQWRAER
jgi:hypothetical protein